MVISPFLALFSNSYMAINNAGKRTAAVNLCRAQMETVKSLGFDSVYHLYVQENNSFFLEEEIPGFPGFQRKTEVELIMFNTGGNPPLELELLLIRITVIWVMRNSEHETVLESYLCSR